MLCVQFLSFMFVIDLQNVLKIIISNKNKIQMIIFIEKKSKLLLLLVYKQFFKIHCAAHQI